MEITCGNAESTTIKNGENGKSAFDIAKEKDPNLTIDEWLASLKGEGCTAKEVEDGVEITCGNEEPVKVTNGKSVTPEKLSAKCTALRSSTDKFNSMYDVFGCLRSYEKVAFILRHAARDKNKTGSTDGLNSNGEAQSKLVGTTLKELDIGDFFYMHTNVYRTQQTAFIISNNKGQTTADEQTWTSSMFNGFHAENLDLLDSWYIQKNATKEAKESCRKPNSWGWSMYSKVAYEEYDNSTIENACKSVFYDIKSRTQEFIDTYFTYDNMHKMTLAISHDQFLVPFVVAISNKQIHDDKNSDLRFHKHENNFNYWINYLTGVAIIVGPDGTTTTIPVTALNDGFLREYN